MLDKLNGQHAEVQSNLLAQRLLLTKERGTIDTELIRIRSQLRNIQKSMDKLILDSPPSNQADTAIIENQHELDELDDEPIELAYETAYTIQQNIQECLAQIQSRINILHKESSWLTNLPNNDIWKGMQQRLEDSLNSLHGIQPTTVEMEDYLKYITDKANITTKEEVRLLFNHVTFAICQDIIREVESVVILDVCNSIVNTIQTCDAQLESFMINVSIHIYI